MNKTTFKIAKMDCPSEEGLIKMKLSGFESIKSLQFDIPNRILDVYHSDNYDDIFRALDSLNFNTTVLSSNTVDDFQHKDNLTQEKKLLWQVLLINLIFFILELITGFLSNSMGLVADGLDMLADTIVYGLALFAVGGTALRKNNIAKASGYFQLSLAILGLVEVFRRFFGFEHTPEFQTMIVISILALIGNALCLYLLQKSKSTDSHMKASMIFTSNDVIVNVGVIVAGVLVYALNNKIPDLLIGLIVFVIVGIGSFRILKLAK